MKFTDFLIGLIMIGFLVFFIECYFSVPVVYWSTSQDKCVKVVYNGIESGCDKLPDRYERVWVK